jgi:hypothetical protein
VEQYILLFFFPLLRYLHGKKAKNSSNFLFDYAMQKGVLTHTDEVIASNCGSINRNSRKLTCPLTEHQTLNT